jgi:hypothetical protein
MEIVTLAARGQMIYAALGSGEIEAGAFSADYRFLGPREFGLNIIDTPSPGYVPVVAGCTRRLVTEDRRLVARVVQGYVEAIHFFKTRRSEVVPVLQQFLGFKDRGAVEAAYDFYAPLFQPSPRPSEIGLEMLLRDSERRQPGTKSLSPADVIEPSFLDELERSGLIQSLYGG